MATALQMLARYPTLLCFAPCIHAFMPQNLFARLMNTGSKQKKGDPDVQVWLRQTSRRLHPFFGACELAALRASSDKRTLVSEKRMLRSAGRRGGAAASNSCEALGSLKIGGWVSGCLRHRKQIKPLPRTPLPTAFSPPDNRRAGLRLRRRGQGRAVFCCVGFGGSGGRRFGRRGLARRG